MSENKNSSGKKFLLGAVVGGVVGAVTALLLAPKSGKEMRSDINEQASVLKERSLELKDTAVERGNEWIAVAKEQSQQVASKVKDMTEQMKPGETGPLTSKNPFLEDDSSTSSD